MHGTRQVLLGVWCSCTKKLTGPLKTGEKLAFGNVMSIEKDKKPIETATRLTGSVAIRIEQKRNMKEYTFGRHWTHESLFVSALNRESIDLLKEHFRDEVPKEVVTVFCASVIGS